MAFALVQSKPKASTTGTNPTVTFAAGPTQGNLIVVVLCTDETNAANITNPSGYTQRATVTVSGRGTVRIVEKIAGASESATVTFTNGTSQRYEIEAYEFSGNAGSGSEFDAASAGANSVSATSLAAGSLTPNVTNELFVVGCNQLAGANGGGEAVDSGFTVIDAATLTDSVHGYKIKTDALAENPTSSWTTAKACVAIQAAFKPGAAAATSPDRHYPRGVERGITRGVA